MPSLTVVRQSWTPGSIMSVQYCLVGYIWTSSDCFLSLFPRIPGKPRSFVYQIPLNEDGVPILPVIDVSESTASQLAQLLDDYLFSLWSTYGYGIKITYPESWNFSFAVFFSEFACGSDENIHEIPWEKVVEDTHQYFDTSLYNLPYALNAPDVLKSKPHQIFVLHDFFLSTSPPFQFRSKDAITKCLTSGGGSWTQHCPGSRSCPIDSPRILNQIFLKLQSFLQLWMWVRVDRL